MSPLANVATLLVLPTMCGYYCINHKTCGNASTWYGIDNARTHYLSVIQQFEPGIGRHEAEDSKWCLLGSGAVLKSATDHIESVQGDMLPIREELFSGLRMRKGFKPSQSLFNRSFWNRGNWKAEIETLCQHLLHHQLYSWIFRTLLLQWKKDYAQALWVRSG